MLRHRQRTLREAVAAALHLLMREKIGACRGLSSEENLGSAPYKYGPAANIGRQVNGLFNDR
jgi:hypothetical protein